MVTLPVGSPKDLFGKASQQFFDSLAPEEKEIFKATTLAEQVLQEVRLADEASKDRTCRKFADRLKPFVAGIEQYGAALDVLSNTSSGILCPLWGGIRVVLHLAREFGDYFNKIATMLEQMGYNLSRLKRYPRLYPDNLQLNQALVEVYRHIFTFCERARAAFGEGKKKKKKTFDLVGLRTVMKLIWKPFKEQFEDIQGNIAMYIDLIEKEVSIAEKEEAHKERVKAETERQTQVSRWEKVEENNAQVEQHNRKVEFFLDEQNIRKVNEWLSPADVEMNHAAASKLRHSGTGKWFLKRPEFERWLDSDQKFLWLYAIPGAGKTVLSSTIVNHLKQNVKSEKIGLAYFYCDYKDPQKQCPTKTLATLLAMLGAQNEGAFLDTKAFFEKQYKENPAYSPSFDELRNRLVLVTKFFSQTLIVIDALDECKDRECLTTTLLALTDTTSSCVKVLVTSRNEIDIYRAFSEFPSVCIQKDNVSDDVESYITAEIKGRIQAKKLKLRDPNLEQEITAKLVEKADGMFQWAKCQIHHLTTMKSDKAIRAALLTLPKTLDDIYVRILEELERESEENIEYVQKILRWLVKGTRTLTLNELAEALSIDLEDEDCTTMDFDAVWTDPEDILELCGSLVTVSPDRTKVGLAHYSVKEFLVSPRTEKSLPKFYMGGAEVEAELAKTCLTYLCFEDFEDGALSDSDEFSQRLEKYHFLKYAALSWGIHAHEHGDGDEALLDLTLKFLRGEEKNFSSWRQVYHHRGNSRLSKSLEFQPLYYASLFGLPGAVKALIAQGADIDAQTGNALQAAALEGHQEVVEILLEKCDVHSGCGKSGNALYAAASRGHEKIVELLLDKGADIEGRRGKHGTALLVAALEGHRPVVQLLLKRGADASVVNKRYGTPLSAAAEKGHERTLRELLDHGADVNAYGGWYGHPLVGAVVANNEKMVRLLIENGADVDAKGGKHQTALIAAAASGNFHITRMLVEKGAQVNDFNDKTGDALHAAAQTGNVEIVTFLIDSGADVNAKGGKHRNALNAACAEGHEGVVRVLLDHGADVNAHDEHYGNALQMAARYGHQGVVRILVGAGADMNSHVGVHRTALQAAAASGRADMIQLLVDLGYPSGDTSDMSGALVLAAFKGHQNVIRLLVKLGANINTHAMTKSQEFWSPLQAASYEGNVEIVQLLLDLGADVNLEGGRYNTALVAFLLNPDTKEDDGIVETLLDAGVDVNAAGDRDYQSPLAAAGYKGCTKFVRLLLEKGANVNASRRRVEYKKWFFETVLQESIDNGHVEIMELLIENGADINCTIFTDPNRKGFANALQTAAGGGLVDIVRRLVELGAKLENDPSGPRSIYRSALQAATANEHIDVVRVLIELGADVNTTGGTWGTALIAASYNGDCDMINLLLDSGAEINACQSGKHGTAIQAAASQCHVDALQLLYNRGADINLRAPNSFGGYPLIAALASECDKDYLEFLIKLGADINAQNPGRHPYFTALQCAAHKNCPDLCETLLDAGADINACGGRLGTALTASYTGGFVQVIQLLRDKGALTDIEGGYYQTALSSAIHGSCQGLFYRLLHGGASPNSMCGAYGCALAASIYWRNDEDWIIKKILESEETNINAVGGFIGTALITAVVCGYRERTEAILERGADIKLHAGRFWTPVTAATRSGDLDMVKLLVEKGAEVNTNNGKSGHFGSALQCGAYWGRCEIVPYLIDQGADVNLKAGRYCTALQAAALRGSEEIVSLLIEKGVDVNAKGGRFGTALAAASISGYLDIVKLLVEKGADVNVEGGLYGNALQSAVINCHEDVAEFLISKGGKPQGNDTWWKNAQRSKRKRSEKLAMRLLGIKGEEKDSGKGRRVGLGKVMID